MINRIVKFRAWNPTTKMMWYEGEMNGFEYYRCYMSKNGNSWQLIRCGRVVASSEDCILEQFADLEDGLGGFLNWWEGDIFDHPGGIHVIKWKEGGLFFHGPDGFSPVGNAANWKVLPEKIGNIHENPELLP